MKTIIIVSLLFFSLFSFAQKGLCIEEDSIYSDLKRRRHSDSIWKTAELNKLKTRCFNEPHNDSVIYLIGQTYYTDFTLPYRENQFSRYRFTYRPQKNIYDSIAFILKEKHFKKSFFINSADSALYYFSKLEKSNSNIKKTLFFVIKQLECFVNSDSSYVDLSSLVTPTDYIPYWYLANLNKNWKCDKSKNYFDLIFTSVLITPDERSSLAYMNERSLYHMELPNNSEIFRLTYEASFHNDICIRVEKKDDKVTLFWKKSRKKYGSIVGIKNKGKKEISIETWQYYMQLLDKFDFLNIPNRSENVMFSDGASWFLEYKTNTTYKAHYNRMPNREINILALYLLELSEVSYKTDKWEPGYTRCDLVLTNDMQYVIIKDIEDTIIECLNQYIDKNIRENKCCCYFDSYLKFNKRGKIKQVRYPADHNWFLDKLWGFQDRECRKEMKRALRKLDLSYLNLQKPIYYYLELCYDKESHKFKREINNCQ